MRLAELGFGQLELDRSQLAPIFVIWSKAGMIGIEYGSHMRGIGSIVDEGDLDPIQKYLQINGLEAEAAINKLAFEISPVAVRKQYSSRWVQGLDVMNLKHCFPRREERAG